MAKTKNLTPKLSNLRPAEQELMSEYRAGERPLGESYGGLQMFSNVFKRGYGNNVFGSDENGIWLGAADYADAPFKVDMQGRIYSESENGGVIIDGPQNRIVIHDGTTYRGLFGDDGT